MIKIRCSRKILNKEISNFTEFTLPLRRYTVNLSSTHEFFSLHFLIFKMSSGNLVVKWFLHARMMGMVLTIGRTHYSRSASVNL